MLGKTEILRLLSELDLELKELDVCGELYLVGGAVMTLVYQARGSTRDLDAYFQPTTLIRQAAGRVAARHGLDATWLNDAVKGYLSPAGSFSHYLEHPNLKVWVAQPEYLLAMKCLSMRLGPEFHDETDVRYLLRYLNIDSYQQALDVIGRYYPVERFPQKTLYALEEILQEN